MPRTRRIPDSAVIDAALRAAAQHGAERVRLTDVSAICGLAPATLLQRFGTREQLLAAVGPALLRQLGDAFRDPASSALRRLTLALARIDAPAHLSLLAGTPAAARSYPTELRKHIGLALMQAVEAGELPPCDVALLARRIQLVYLGLATAARLEAVPTAEADVRQAIEDSLSSVL